MKSGISLKCCFGLFISALACPNGYTATFTVTNILAIGPGSLSNAIVQANTSPGLDIIEFNIPGPGVQTISITNALPNITSPMIIDGYTQPGATPNTLADGNNANLLIELSGGGRNLDGLNFSGGGSNCTVRGLVLNGFNGFAAIHFNFGTVVASSNVVEGCFIGTDPTGTIARGNINDGVRTIRAVGNRIGGVSPAARSIISANRVGIRFAINSSNNVVQGNFIGTDRTGTNSLANTSFGISIETTSHTCTIGGTNVAARNIIAQGISASTSVGHLIQGNFIGTDVTGTKVLNPLTVMLSLSASSCLIGGIAPVPGTPPGNVIAGAQINNVTFDDTGSDPPPAGNVIQGNLIGTDATGTLDLGNASHGINLINAINNTIGGTEAGAGNVISGHGSRGIFIQTGSRGNVIQGNRIGTDITGRNPLPNATQPSSHTITVADRDNVIGPGNIIAFNGNDGVNLSAASATNNRITANSIFANGNAIQHLGIDLGTDGVTSNDAGDADIGANRLQNFPVLTSVVVSLAGVTFQGVLSSAPNTVYTVEFFANDICESTGSCEGQTFIGSTNLTTDASGTNLFSVTLPGSVLCRFQASATATDPAGNTSEFSACRPSTGVDTDGDGACDVEELLAGTDPNNPNSVFRIISIRKEGDSIRVAWQAGGERTNMLQTVTHLESNSCSNNFVDLPPATALPVAGDVFTNRVHIGGGTDSARFYRLRLVR